MMTLGPAVVSGERGAYRISGRIIAPVAFRHGPLHDRRNALSHAS